MKTDEKEKEMQTAQEKEIAPTEKELVLSELHQPMWAVVSFEKVIKNGLNYDEALAEMERLKSEKVFGLCIITDEAAERI
jgi:hypothetical protein